MLGYCRVLKNVSDLQALPGEHEADAIKQADDSCSSAKLGYELTTALQFAFGQSVVNTSLNKLTYGLVLHMVTAGLTLIAFLIAALSQRFGFIASAVIAGLAWVFSLITMAIDLALFLPARSKLQDSGASVSWGIGFWCAVAATVLLFFGALFTLFSVCTDRKKKRLGVKGPEYAYVPPVMGYNYGQQPFNQPVMAPLVQQTSYSKY